MTNESILISEVIPATPQRIFSAWMDSAEHSAFTGDEATVVPEVGGEHQSAGGYIKGRTLELNEGSRIVQSWRTTEFPPESPDSRVEITLEPTLGGTLVTLLHTDIPVGQGDRYRQGWNEYYLSRLKTYFADSEPTMETKAPPGELGVEDADVESEVVELDASTEDNEAPTRIMSQAARPKATPKKPPAMKAKPPAAAAKPAVAKPVAAKPKAAKPALKAKATAKVASKKPARLAMKSTKKVAAKAKRSKAPAMKAAARKPAKAAKKPAKKSGGKAGTKKGASSARSRRR